MGIEHRDLTNMFIQEAIRLFDEKEPQTKLLVQRVSRRFMVTSKKIQRGDIQKLNAHLFGNKIKTGSLLLEKIKNRNRD